MHYISYQKPGNCVPGELPHRFPVQAVQASQPIHVSCWRRCETHARISSSSARNSIIYYSLVIGYLNVCIWRYTASVICIFKFLVFDVLYTQELLTSSEFLLSIIAVFNQTNEMLLHCMKLSSFLQCDHNIITTFHEDFGKSANFWKCKIADAAKLDFVATPFPLSFNHYLVNVCCIKK